jgi:YegS/Rv2252/BmrU family lipid kinase
MKPVAVIAHTKKTLGGGLGELRRLLDEREITDPMWFEISSSKKARKSARRAVKDGADLVIAWGGDGTVQRCIDVLAGTAVTLAVIPAGTANLFATNVGIPIDLESAVDVAAEGLVSCVDVGVANGEHFGVMAGVGFDVAMLDAADRSAKKRFGKAAYVWTGMQAARSDPIKMQIAVDGEDWFVGPATCLLIGNVPNVIGGLQVFPSASPVSGTLEVGVVTADGLVDWGRVLTSVVRKQPEKSTFVKLRHGQSIDLEMKGKHGYELDGGTREPVKRLEFRVKPQALRIMVPRESSS